MEKSLLTLALCLFISLNFISCVENKRKEGVLSVNNDADSGCFCKVRFMILMHTLYNSTNLVV